MARLESEPEPLRERSINLSNAMKYIINQEKLASYLSDKKLEDKCTLCGNGKLELLSDTIYGVYDFPFAEYGGGEYKAILLLPITCRNCGNTRFINAYQQGLLEPLKEAFDEE